MPTTVLKESELSDGVIDILSALVKAEIVNSRSEARRAVEQGGVAIEGEKITDIHYEINTEMLKQGIIVKKGKKTFKKLMIE